MHALLYAKCLHAKLSFDSVVDGVFEKPINLAIVTVAF